jgi:hypothetical protein
VTWLVELADTSVLTPRSRTRSAERIIDGVANAMDVDLDRFRRYTRWHRYANRRRYDAPADPWKVVRVDPEEVTFYAVVSLKWGLGRVRGGEWDRRANCGRVSDVYIHEGLTQRFEEGYDWEETAYYRWARNQFDAGNTVRGYETLEAFRTQRCEYVDDLFESVREEGYRPNFETTYDDPGEVEYAHDLEPLVLVGRSGEIIWSEGFHRLVVASILGIDEIPVYVLRRHEQWQEVRDAIDGVPATGLPPELEAYTDHPDVRDVLA